MADTEQRFRIVVSHAVMFIFIEECIERDIAKKVNDHEWMEKWLREKYEQYVVQFLDYAEAELLKVTRHNKRMLHAYFEVTFPTKSELHKMKLKDPELYNELLMLVDMGESRTWNEQEEPHICGYENLNPEVFYHNLEESMWT